MIRTPSRCARLTHVTCSASAARNGVSSGEIIAAELGAKLKDVALKARSLKANKITAELGKKIEKVAASKLAAAVKSKK